MRNKYRSGVLLSILLITSLMTLILSFSIMSKTASANPTPGVWENKAQWPGIVDNTSRTAIACYAENQGVAYIYSLQENTYWQSPELGCLYRYKISDNVWENMGFAPSEIITGGMVWTGGDNIYVLTGGSWLYNKFYLYKISDNSWTPLDNYGYCAFSGTGLAWDSGDNIYASTRAFQPSYKNDLWVYSISGTHWTDKIALPETNYPGSTLCKVGNYLYYGAGGTQKYYRYDIANNTWEALANVPSAGGNWGAGSGQENVNENIIYADLGGETKNFYRFIIPDNRWDNMESLPDNVKNQGDRLSFDGTYLYLIRGYWENSFWRYEVPKYFETACTACTPHAPIYINGDSGFTSPDPVNGGGSGTVSDPYIIENWCISAENANGIYIRNTTAYFIVRNCCVENGGTAYDGIFLDNAINGAVDSNICDNNNNGIHLEYSSHDNVTNNTCGNGNNHGILIIYDNYIYITSNILENNPHDGIGMDWANYNTIEYNTFDNDNYCFHTVACNNNIISNNNFSNSAFGISIENSSDNNTVSNNNCNGCQGGIVMYVSSFYNTIENNTCENAYYGIYLYSSSNYNIIKNNTSSNNLGDYARGIYLNDTCDNNVIENNICENDYYGIYLYSSSNYNIINNNICETNYYGIRVTSSSYNTITRNYLLTNTASNAYDNGTNSWDNGYPSGGNYWSDYTGHDNYQGENQNIQGGDGIGDNAYNISGGANQDRYPLMSPFAGVIRGVSISITPPSQENDNGGTLTYTVTVNNTGNVQENFQLTKGDNSSWTMSLDNNWLLVSMGDNRTTKLTVNIPTNAMLGTWDNIWVKAASKDNENVWDNESCLAHVVNWMGTATFGLENMYKVSLEKDLQLYAGSKLVVKFYDYSSSFESGVVIDNIPPQSVVENENVPHPAQGSLPVRTAVKKAELDLTTDNENEVISTIASFTVHQNDLRTLYGNILRAWASQPEQQSAFRAEIGDILREWSGAPP